MKRGESHLTKDNTHPNTGNTLNKEVKLKKRRNNNIKRRELKKKKNFQRSSREYQQERSNMAR